MEIDRNEKKKTTLFVADYPILKVEWDYEQNQPLIPEQVPHKSHKKVNWICSEGHRWPATISNRAKGSGCPYCAGKLPIPGKTDFATVYPDIAEQWDYENNGGKTPQDVCARAHQSANWICSEGHRWPARITDRAKGNGCPYCAGKLPIPGKTDLASVFPDLAKEWDYENNGGKTPQEVCAHADQYANWICSEGHKWRARINKRATGRGCPYCAGTLPIPGKTDLASVFPDLAKEWDYENNGGKTPQDVCAHADQYANWICSEGHRWPANISARAKGSGCPYCAGTLPVPGKTDLASVFPDLAKEWDYENNGGKTPQNVCAHAGQRANWICSEGHRWPARITDRANGSGCPYCAGKKKRGFR